MPTIRRPNSQPNASRAPRTDADTPREQKQTSKGRTAKIGGDTDQTEFTKSNKEKAKPSKTPRALTPEHSDVRNKEVPAQPAVYSATVASQDVGDEFKPAQIDAMYVQWSGAPLLEAMAQIKEWRTGGHSLQAQMLLRLARDEACSQVLTKWLQPPKLAAHQRQAYAQAIETLIEQVGPAVPAPFVMAQLEATNIYLAPFNEHHALLELLQSQLHKNTAPVPTDNLKALICASFQLLCGHTHPEPGWLQMQSWGAALQRLPRSQASDACFVALLQRVQPCDLHTVWHRAERASSRRSSVAWLLLSWPGAEALLPTASPAWQSFVKNKQEAATRKIIGTLSLREPDSVELATHHINYLRRAADGMMLSPWWTSMHAHLAVEMLGRLQSAPKAMGAQSVEDLLMAFADAPFARIEPVRAFAAEILMGTAFSLTGDSIAKLLRLEPTLHGFERVGFALRYFWVSPQDLLAATHAAPEFMADYIARHQSEVLGPSLQFLEAGAHGSVAQQLLRQVDAYAPHEAARFRHGLERARWVQQFWRCFSDYSDADHSVALAQAIHELDLIEPDMHHYIGSRPALVGATDKVATLSPLDKGPLDRADLWRSVMTGRGVGDNLHALDNLHNEEGYVLDPLHPQYAPAGRAPLQLPKILVQRLEQDLNLEPIADMRDAALTNTTTLHRRQVLGRLLLMASVAHRSEADLLAQSDLMLTLINHPRAYEWPLACAAFVLHCMRHDAFGAQAAGLVKRLQTAPVPIDVVVSLQIMGAFGQGFLQRPEVQYTVAHLLRKDSGAERIILSALFDYGETLVEAEGRSAHAHAASTPIYQILRGVGSVVTTHVLTEQIKLAKAPVQHSDSKSAKVQAARTRRQKICEAMLQEHHQALGASLATLSDWERIDAESAFDAAGQVLEAQGQQLTTPSKLRARKSLPQALGLYAAKSNISAVQHLYGDLLLPTTLALLRHQASLVQLRGLSPLGLVNKLNQYTTPAQVVDAVPRLLSPTAWAKLDALTSARPEMLALSIAYAHGLKRVRQEWAQGFVRLLEAYTQGEHRASRLEHGQFVKAIQSAPGRAPSWTKLWLDGAQLPIAAGVLAGSRRPSRLLDTDDFLLTMFSGSDVTGSCQSLHASPSLNCGLLSRLQISSKRMVAIVDDQDKIFARAVFYLVEREQQGFGLFLGPVYGATQADKTQTSRLLVDFAQSRAQKLALPLFTADMVDYNTERNGPLQTVFVENAGLPDYVDGVGITEARSDILVFPTPADQAG